MNPRCRSTMEDAHAIVDGFGGEAGSGFFGVYDGHGGRNVAEYLRLHLHNNVERELREKGDRTVEECLRAAFVVTDVECRDTGEQASGSTAAVCIVRQHGAKRYVYSANVGDARSVLCHAGVAVRLSKVREAARGHERARARASAPSEPPAHPPERPFAHTQDHKATDACERMRVESMGGFVIRKRVMGVLAVARSFGDFVLKKYVPAEPYTSATRLDEMVREIDRAGARGGCVRLRAHHTSLPPPSFLLLLQSEFLIIACDGVWDVMEDQEAVDMVRMHVHGGSAAAAGTGAGPVIVSDAARGDKDVRMKSAAQLLVDTSLARGSSDNVTALILFL